MRKNDPVPERGSDNYTGSATRSWGVSLRGPHLGGAPGAALWAQFVERGWVAKQQGTRAIIVTDEGKQWLQEQFGVR